MRESAHIMLVYTEVTLVREVCRSDRALRVLTFSIAMNLTGSRIVIRQVLVSVVGHIGEIRSLACCKNYYIILIIEENWLRISGFRGRKQKYVLLGDPVLRLHFT
jgi:hypothetical protein